MFATILCRVHKNMFRKRSVCPTLSNKANFNTHIYLGLCCVFFSHLLSLWSQTVWNFWFLLTLGQHFSWYLYCQSAFLPLPVSCFIDVLQDWSTIILLQPECAVNRSAGQRVVVQTQLAVTSQEVADFLEDLMIKEEKKPRIKHNNYLF
jgi:hypothetical protein